ncbi:MAG: hypothetical protein ACK5U3_20555, partial [Pseudomonadota bacterium]
MHRARSDVPVSEPDGLEVGRHDRVGITAEVLQELAHGEVPADIGLAGREVEARDVIHESLWRGGAQACLNFDRCEGAFCRPLERRRIEHRGR